MKRVTLWSLYERPRGSKGRWTRVGMSAFAKQVAIRVYQDRLLTSAIYPGPTELSLRRVV